MPINAQDDSSEIVQMIYFSNRRLQQQQNKSFFCTDQILFLCHILKYRSSALSSFVFQSSTLYSTHGKNLNIETVESEETLFAQAQLL